MAKRFLSGAILPLTVALLINLLLFSTLVILSRPKVYQARHDAGQPIRLAPYPGPPVPVPSINQASEAPREKQPVELPALDTPTPPQPDVALDITIDTPLDTPKITPELDLDVEVPELPPLPTPEVKIAPHKVPKAKKRARPKRKRSRRPKAAPSATTAATGPTSTQHGTPGGRGSPAPASGTNGAMGFDQAEVKPVLIHRVEPRYPLRARRRRMSGYVVVRFLVDRNGRVHQATVIKASPPGVFEGSALQAVRRWRFRPGRHRGRTVSVWVVQPIRFKMIDR